MQKNVVQKTLIALTVAAVAGLTAFAPTDSARIDARPQE